MATITITADKLDVTNDKKEIVRSMYSLTIGNGKEELKMSVGKTTYETIKKMKYETTNSETETEKGGKPNKVGK